MGGLTSVLSDASSGMDAQTLVTSVASQNIQNADNPNYALETAVLQANQPDTFINGVYLGNGASVQTVTETRNTFVEAQLPTAFGQASMSQAQSDALSGVNALNPDAGDGLTSALGNFYAAIQSLSQDPSNEGLRQATVGQAQALAAALNQAGQGLTSARDGLDSQIASNLPQVNQAAAQLAQLNQEIRTASANGAQPNDLLDARHAAEDQLAQLTGAVPVTDAQGDVSMVLSNGLSLVNGNVASTLSAVPDPNNGGHLALQVTPPGGPAIALTNSDVGGSLGGMLSARDGALENAQAGLDQIAFDLGNAVNIVNAAGFGLQGQTGNDLFTVSATASGAASSLSVNAAVVSDPDLIAAASTNPPATGDSSNLTTMFNTQTQVLSGGGTASNELSSLVGQFGSAQSNATDSASADSTALTSLTNLRASASGVSVNDETVTLTQAQQVFQALSQVIQTTDTMVQSLLQIPVLNS